MEGIKILIIEDEVLIAHDISSKLSKNGYEPIGICRSADHALFVLESKKPDLIICDINIQGDTNGIELATQIRQKYKIPLIFLTSFGDSDTISRAKKALPYAYLVKPFTRQDLLSSIEIALHKYRSELENKKMTREKWDAHTDRPLTDMEHAVLNSLLGGLKNSEIAEKHFISERTVKFHLSNIYTKLQVNNRAEVLHLAVKHLTQ